MLLSLLLACDTPAEPAPAPAAAPVALEEPAPPPAAPEPAAAGITEGAFAVTPVYHGTAIIQHGGKTLWLDPWSKGDLAAHGKADIVLITDVHSDHMDPAALSVVAGEGAVIVAPAAVQEKLSAETSFTVDHVIGNGESVTLGTLTVTGVPMYNLTRGPESGGLFHDKGRGNGYLLSDGTTTLYFAGDTACTDEMKALTGVDLAFVPMNLPYTMTPEEAAECVAAFLPARAIPYHYAGSNLAGFAGVLADVGAVSVETAEFYPGGLPW